MVSDNADSRRCLEGGLRHGTCVSAPTCRLAKRILRKHGYPPDKQEAATKP